MKIIRISTTTPSHPRFTPEDIAEVMEVVGPNLMEDPTEYDIFDEEIKAIPEVKEAAKAGWIKFLESHPEEIDSVPEEFKSDPRLSAAPQDMAPQAVKLGEDEPMPVEPMSVEPIGAELPLEEEPAPVDEPLMTPVQMPKKKGLFDDDDDTERIIAAKKTLARLEKLYSTSPDNFKKRFVVNPSKDDPNIFKVKDGDGKVVFIGDVFGALKALKQIISKDTVAKHINQEEQEKQQALNSLNFSVTDAKPKFTGNVDLGMSEEEFKEMSGKKYVPRIQDRLDTMKDDE